MPVQILFDEGGTISAIESVPEGMVEFNASVVKQGDTIVLEGLHLEELEGATLKLPQIRRLCDEFCRHYRIERLVVREARRTTGKSAGKILRPLAHRLRQP